ncbi:MAG: thymidylate synthase [Erysipelotrichaceae bacterium]
MKQYLDLCSHILENGELRLDRTGTGTKSCFGYQMRFDLTKGFPLLTTKKVAFEACKKELLWFLSGSTNIQPLVKENVRIWNEWPYAKFQNSEDYKGEDMATFIERIGSDDSFAKQYGELGPVYGKQWRDFFGKDQLLDLIHQLKTNPFSRRHIISAWNPAQIEEMALPPCHAFMQFYVSADGKGLSCQLYQRSADVFLGVPFNIASYALLTHMIAQVVGLEPREFIHTFGDVHIYSDHFEQIETQLQREPKALCTLRLNPDIKDIEGFSKEDIWVEHYEHHPRIEGKVSV